MSAGPWNASRISPAAIDPESVATAFVAPGVRWQGAGEDRKRAGADRSRQRSPARAWSGRPLDLHPELFQIQVALHSAMDLVRDRAALAKAEERLALRREDRQSDLAMLAQLLLRLFVPAAAITIDLRVMRPVVVLSAKVVDQLSMTGPLDGEVVEARRRRLRGHASSVCLLLAGRGRAVVDPQPGYPERERASAIHTKS